MQQCDMCLNNAYDGETGEYYCVIEFDEDETAEFFEHSHRGCPYYDPTDEYSIVKKQN
ncbi:MAG: DUF6472 family protein [Oscillospiraceae bacterium]|nr:DUF6472 family protein [Oscillospiraceae bacterium]